MRVTTNGRLEGSQVVRGVKRMKGGLPHNDRIVKRLSHEVRSRVHRRTKPVTYSQVLEGGWVDSKALHVITARSQEAMVEIVSAVGWVRRQGRGGRELRQVALVLFLFDERTLMSLSIRCDALCRVWLCKALVLGPLRLFRLCYSTLVFSTSSLLWLVAPDSVTEASISHPCGMSICNGL